MKLDIRIKEKIILIMISLLLLVFASFWDLNISVLLVDFNSIFALIFENHILLFVFVPVIYAALSIWKVTRNNFYILGSVLLSLYTGFQNVGRYTKGFSYIIMAIIVSILIFLLLFVSVFVKKEEVLSINLELFYKVILIFITTVTIIHLIKFLNGRIRYRDFTEYASYSQFTNWYDFKLFAKGSSFPSGHTSTMYVLIPILGIYKKDTSMIRYIAYTLVFLMTFTRIRIGAHFLSDTVVGLIIAVIIDLFVSYYGEKYFERKRTSI